MNERDVTLTITIGRILLELCDIARCNIDDTDFGIHVARKLDKVNAEIIMDLSDRQED